MPDAATRRQRSFERRKSCKSLEISHNRIVQWKRLLSTRMLVVLKDMLLNTFAQNIYSK